MLQYMDEQKCEFFFILLLNKVAQIILDFVHEQNTCFDFSVPSHAGHFSTVTMFVSGSDPLTGDLDQSIYLEEKNRI